MNTPNEHYQEHPARNNGARAGIIIAIIAVLALPFFPSRIAIR